MKVLLAATAAVLIAQASAFTTAPSIKNPHTTRVFAEYEPMEGEGKINLKVDLDSPKVATMV
jgi:hypothetical protein